MNRGMKYSLYALVVVLVLGLGLFVAAQSLAPKETASLASQNVEPISVPPTPAVATQPEPEPHSISFPSLFKREFNGSELKLVRVLEKNAAYTRHYITYKSGELMISGIMNVPAGKGPFPVLILNHGHIDTSVYTNGRGLRREQDYLARAGYVVVHPDYRNHAQSSKDNRDELAVRLSYVEDVINAVHAVRNSGLEFIDSSKIGMLGHSMGGGIALSVLVTQPDLVDAAVLYAPVSGDMRKSYERWMSRRPESASRITELYGSPTSSPEFWNNVSAETFYDRVQAPVAIFHGTADKDVPLEWSEQTRDLLSAKNKAVSLTVYPNAPHEFATDWTNFMRSVESFFNKELKTN